MNGRFPLNLKEGARLYWELSKRGAYASGEKFFWRYEPLNEEELFTLALLQARYDPRLVAILIDFFQTPRPEIHPIRFKEELRKQGALVLAAVVGEIVIEAKVSSEVEDFFRFLMSGVSPLPTQLFYKSLYPVGSRKMDEAICRPLWAFKKWGFLAADSPLLKERVTGKRHYLFDQASRMHILREISEEKKSFRLRDYLTKLHASISRQQALQDLKGASWIRKSGKGKGTVYEVRTARADSVRSRSPGDNC